MSSGGSPPPAPDVVGAAQAQGSQQLANTFAAQQGSLISQKTPYGSLQYSQGPVTPQGNPTYQSTTTLSPAMQALLEGQQGAQQSLIPAAQGLAGQAAGNYSKPMDLSSIGQVENQSFQNQMGLLQPQIDRNTEMANSRLINQGLQPGTEAYQNAMRDVNTGNNNLMLGASQQAINTMPQTYNLANSIYNQPATSLQTMLGDINPQSPTFGNNPQQQVAGAAPLAQAAQAQGQYGLNAYNAQVGQQNSQMNGLFGLGSAGINSGLFGSGSGGGGLISGGSAVGPGGFATNAVDYGGAGALGGLGAAAGTAAWGGAAAGAGDAALMGLALL